MKISGLLGVVLLITTSFFAGLLVFPQTAEAEYIPHDPIHIDGNVDFSEQATTENLEG